MKYSKIKIVFSSLLILASVISCKDDFSDNKKTEYPSFYVAGAGIDNVNERALVWVNGIAVYQGNPAVSSSCSSVSVYGDQLYTAVSEDGISYIYKGGEKFITIPVLQEITYLTVSDGIVYSCGNTATGFAVFRNGEAFLSGEGKAVKVVIYQGNIYTVVNKDAALPSYIEIWKGTELLHTLSKAGTGLCATDAVYENGYLYTLTEQTVSATETLIKVYRDASEYETIGADNKLVRGASSLFIYDTNIYIGGYEVNASGVKQAKIWKNGLLYYSLDGGAKESAVSSVVYSKGFVYSTGYVISGTEKTPVVWWENAILYKMLGHGSDCEVNRMLAI